jgi:hypothetical protein
MVRIFFIVSSVLYAALSVILWGWMATCGVLLLVGSWLVMNLSVTAYKLYADVDSAPLEEALWRSGHSS